METIYFEVQGRLKGSEGGWHRVGRQEWINEVAARSEYTEFTGPLYANFRKSHHVRLVRIATSTTIEEVSL